MDAEVGPMAQTGTGHVLWTKEILSWHEIDFLKFTFSLEGYIYIYIYTICIYKKKSFCG